MSLETSSDTFVKILKYFDRMYTRDTPEDTCNNLINKEAFTVFQLVVECYELQ